MNKIAEEIRVWDPVVRIFHWAVMLFVLIALLTEDDYQRLHLVAGYLVFGLVLARILWGFAGTRHARFSDFIFPPRVVITYLKDLARLRAPRYLGHGPAGGTMVLALLASLLGAAVSGIALHGGQEYGGPLAGAMLHLDAYWILVIEKIHEFFAGLILVLVGLHVAGVLFSSFAHRENLVRGMVTGMKRSGPTWDETPRKAKVTSGRPGSSRPIPVGTAILQKGGASLKGFLIAVLTTLLLVASHGISRASAVDELLQDYRGEGATAFDAASGESFWKKTFVDAETGEERSCTTCHRANLRSAGEQANTGKRIEPMAPSVNPERLTDPKFIEKWFLRNCKWTLGRECSPAEKGNVLLFLNGQ